MSTKPSMFPSVTPGVQGGRLLGLNEIALSALPPLSLYIHLPWCVQKCPYCDFNSHLAPQSPFKGVSIQSAPANAPDRSFSESLPLRLQRRYAAALIADLDQQLPKVWGRSIQTVFFGGGTPSLFHPEVIDSILSAVRARLGQPVLGEVTLEANPGTFELERFRAYNELGITRLSIGTQSFDSRALNRLGRVHSPDQAVAAIESAVGLFDGVNVDIMYGLPLEGDGVQSVELALADVKQAIALGPDHLSLYQLTLEPNTAFEKHPPRLPGEALLHEIEQAVHDTVKQAGYARYEVSAFAGPGGQCKHNLNYWQFGDYLGIGAGAHAKISFHDRVIRETRLRNPQAYMEAIEAEDPVHTTERLDVRDLPFEFMLNGLRLIDGVPESFFVERCGRPLNDMQHTINVAIERGLLSSEPGQLKPTELGFQFLNDLQSIFLQV